MTAADLDALNRRIFTAHPELAAGWKPADNSLSKREFIGTRNEVRWAYPDEIPPPNIMDWDTFGRVLVATKAFIGWNDRKWYADMDKADIQYADSPQLALGLAVDAMEEK